MNLPALALFGSVLLSAVHALEELFGDPSSLGTYFARLYGIGPAPALAVDAGVALLPGALAFLAALGYACGVPWAMWALCGWRLADGLLMHWLPWLLLEGGRPNPGLLTATLGLLEAGLVLACLAG
jgi:hypothetical protein